MKSKKNASIDFHYMSSEEKENWLAKIVHGASEKVNARPENRKSLYWKERQRQIQQAIEEKKINK